MPRAQDTKHKFLFSKSTNSSPLQWSNYHEISDRGQSKQDRNQLEEGNKDKRARQVMKEAMVVMIEMWMRGEKKIILQ